MNSSPQVLEATEALNSICNDIPDAAPPESNIAQPNPRALDHNSFPDSLARLSAYSFPESLARLSQMSERGSGPEAPPPPRPLESETTHPEARPGVWWAGL